MVTEVGQHKEGQCGGKKGGFLNRFADNAGTIIGIDSSLLKALFPTSQWVSGSRPKTDRRRLKRHRPGTPVDS
jgi:hypothetical protein